jgi:hypothetical protein
LLVLDGEGIFVAFALTLKEIEGFGGGAVLDFCLISNVGLDDGVDHGGGFNGIAGFEGDGNQFAVLDDIGDDVFLEVVDVVTDVLKDAQITDAVLGECEGEDGGGGDESALGVEVVVAGVDVGLGLLADDVSLTLDDIELRETGIAARGDEEEDGSEDERGEYGPTDDVPALPEGVDDGLFRMALGGMGELA